MSPALRLRLFRPLCLLGALALLPVPDRAADPPAPAVSPPAAASADLITSGAELWNIPEAQRNEPHTARIEITATYYDPFWKLLWGADRDSQAYFPLESTSPRLRSGQRFVLSGTFIPSRGLPLATADLAILSDTATVAPLAARGRIADVASLNGRLVTVEGFVNAQAEVDPNHLRLDLAVEGLAVSARLLLADNAAIPQLDGAFVRVTGVYVANDAPGLVRPNLWIARPEAIEITGWLEHDPRFNAPVRPIDQLPAGASAEFVHVVGRVQSQKPGEQIVLRDDTGQATLLTAMTRPLEPGTLVEAIGRPAARGLNSLLRESLYRVARTAPHPTIEGRGLALLRLAEQVRRLGTDEAERSHAVRLSGTVAWAHPQSRTVYLLDSSGSVEVTLPADLAEPPGVGVRIEVLGRSAAGSFAPRVLAQSLRVNEDLPLPEPRPVTLEQAMTGVEEGQWISLQGYVRDIRDDGPWTRILLTTSAGEFVAVAPRSPRLEALEGAVLEIHGICRATADSNRQLTGIELWAPREDDVRIEQPKPADPFAEPARSLASLRRFNTLEAFNRRVRLTGTVLFQAPGAYFNLQDGNQTLLVLSRSTTALRPGDLVEVVGFPGRQGPRVVLREAVYRRVGHYPDPAPVDLGARQFAAAELDGRLVRVEATLVDLSRRPGGARLVCQAGDTLFEAQFSGAAPALAPDRLVGGRGALTGVYVMQFDAQGRPRGFQLQLRSARDLAVLAAPPWWTATRAGSVAAGLGLAVLLGVVWVVALRRRVRHQTSQIREQLEKSSRLEAELVRSSKLESLGVLAGGIAHDFNNLLTVVIGNLSLVITGRQVSAEDEGFLRESERAALRARDLTQQLLTFAKGGAPVRSAVLLPDIVREAAGFALHGSKVRGDFDFAPGLWPAHVDRGQVSQVVHNIVINALHAMLAGGVVRITLRNETLAADSGLPLEPGRFLKLSLRDTGSGISPSHLPQIFDPYFTTKQTGSGLGLATVYSIVRKHAGHISVESTLGQGTAFHIWLPAAEAPATPTTSSVVQLPHLTGRALLMDDESSVREMAGAMLRRLGLEPTTAGDGAEVVKEYAAARAAGRPYAVVILDLTVPGAMGGHEAIAALRAIDPEVRAIVSSGYSNDPIIADFQRYGFRGRVPKPYEVDQLAAALVEVLPPVPATV